jgi:pimeloyl-ACP methyl ester carboxylesterase
LHRRNEDAPPFSHGGSAWPLDVLVVAVVLLGSLAASVAAQTGRPLQRMTVNGGEVEYETSGSGDPVLLIHGSGVAATFAPTMTEPSLAQYRLIRYHRRGYAGSGRAPVPFTVKDQAADALALLKALGVSRAHIVGHSYGGQIALQLALDAPAVVRSLVIMEPPIFNANGPSPFAKLEAMYASGDKQGAMATFSQMSYGPEWRTLAARVPGGPAQVERDVDTVFQSEAPAMTKWGFDAAQAARITQPIVYVTGGGAHGGSLKQLRVWIPKIEDVVVPGVTHAMLMQDPKAVADAIAAFLAKH